MSNETTEAEMRLIRDAEIADRAHANLMTDLREVLRLCEGYRKVIKEQAEALEKADEEKKKELKEEGDKKT